MLETALANIDEELGSSQENVLWIEALPARLYTTPQYGEVPVTVDKLNRMVTNFNSNVRGQEIATDFEHGLDQSKGKQASGWYREFAVRPSTDDPEQQSLWAKVEFTDDAKKEIEAKKWRYWSLEWDDEYFVNDTGDSVPDVIIGGGLTNRPVAKRTMPINFSEELWNELDEDTQKQFAVWSTAQVNDLPDSCFLYIESGGKKDSDGKTTPRSLRHLPYKNSSGKIDLPHLRNAIARIPQMKGISDSLKSSLQAKARRLLGGSNKQNSESPEVQAAFELLTIQGYEVTPAFAEQKEWEHSWPGTGSPPTPQLGSPEQPDPGTGQYVPPLIGDVAQENPDIGGGWRWDPLPRVQAGVPPQSGQIGQPPDPGAPNVGNMTPKPGGTLYTKFSEDAWNVVVKDVAKGGGKLNLAELGTIVGLSSEGVNFEDEAQTTAFSGKVKERLETVFSEHAALKQAVNVSNEEKQFAEKFPTVWREHQEMIERDREGKARAFAESVHTITRTEGDKQVKSGSGLSALALDKVADVHKKFSEGKVTAADFEDVIKTITSGGIVQYGENGSSRIKDEDQVIVNTSSMAGLQNARKLFAEKIGEVQAEHKDDPNFSYAMAINEAAKRHPDLADAYQMAAPA
jgi:hypothetical protein